MVARLLSRKREDAHPDYGLEQLRGAARDAASPSPAASSSAAGSSSRPARGERDLVAARAHGGAVLGAAVRGLRQRQPRRPRSRGDPRPLRARPVRPRPRGARSSPTVAAARSPASAPRSSSPRRRSSSSSSGSRARSPTLFGLDADPAAVAIWLALFAAAVGARDPHLPSRPGLELRSGGRGPAPGAAGRPVRALQAHDAGVRSRCRRRPGRSSRALARKPPDVYFFLLDGYGRADQLERTIGFDNAAFLGALARRGFEVHERGDGRLPGDLPLARLDPVDGLSGRARRARGPHSLLRRRRRRQRGGRCLPPPRLRVRLRHRLLVLRVRRAGRPLHRALARRASRASAASARWRSSARRRSRPLLPALGLHSQPPARLPLARGRRRARSPRERSGEPLFAYAHLLTPHPPYRYLEGCALREDLTDPEIDYWGEAAGEGGEEYRQAIECVNRSLPARDRRDRGGATRTRSSSSKVTTARSSGSTSTAR